MPRIQLVADIIGINASESPPGTLPDTPGTQPASITQAANIMSPAHHTSDVIDAAAQMVSMAAMTDVPSSSHRELVVTEAPSEFWALMPARALRVFTRILLEPSLRA